MFYCVRTRTQVNLSVCDDVCLTDRKPQFANLVTHPGFSDQLCYGDVSLRFMYTWSDLSKCDRDLILRQNHGLQSPTTLHSHDVSNRTTQWVANADCESVVKVKVTYICIVPLSWLTPKVIRYGSHRFTCRQHHTCLYLVNIHQMAPQMIASNCSLLIIYWRRNEWKAELA